MRALLLVLAACSGAHGESRPTGPIVLELFTSEGCSSCPPADKLLQKFARDPALAPLSFHVDYWDDLGWADPYAQPAWTDRQRGYATDRVFTPQLVIGGRESTVGSNAVTIASALGRTSAPALLPVQATWSKDALTVRASASGAEVFVALYEDGVRTKVTRGENAGATLAHDRVVRRFERIPAGQTLTLHIDPAWRRVGAVAFAQRADRTIVASARLAR